MGILQKADRCMDEAAAFFGREEGTGDSQSL